MINLPTVINFHKYAEEMLLKSGCRTIAATEILFHKMGWQIDKEIEEKGY